MIDLIVSAELLEHFRDSPEGAHVIAGIHDLQPGELIVRAKDSDESTKVRLFAVHMSEARFVDAEEANFDDQRHFYEVMTQLLDGEFDKGTLVTVLYWVQSSRYDELIKGIDQINEVW